MQSNFEKLFERYKFERQNPELSIEEFEILVFLFPAILIVYADGHIDTTEALHLNKLSVHLAGLLNITKPIDLRAEIRYLGWSTKVWRSMFLQGLIERITLRKLEHEMVDILVTAASASTGSLINNILSRTLNPGVFSDTVTKAAEEKVEFISDDEKNEIVEIVQYLGFTALPDIVAKVKNVIGVDITEFNH